MWTEDSMPLEAMGAWIRRAQSKGHFRNAGYGVERSNAAKGDQIGGDGQQGTPGNLGLVPCVT